MKVAIVGSAPSSEHLAPYHDHTWEIWVTATRFERYPRVDKIFAMHEPDIYGPALVDKLQSDPRVVSIHPYLTNAEPFPFEAAAKMFQDYLTSTPAYMMAYAILQGAGEIGLFGVDMSVTDQEYFHQLPCMAAWIGFAKGKGIKVTIPAESSLLKSTYLYGVHDMADLTSPPFTAKEFEAMAEQHAGVVAKCQAEIERLTTSIHTHNGCRQAFERMSKVARAVAQGQQINHLTDTVNMQV